MDTDYRTNQFKVFIGIQNEAIEAIKSGDRETMHFALMEIETLMFSTNWPRLVQAAGAFLHLHAEHMPTDEERDAYDLAALQAEIEDGVAERDTFSVRVNLGSVESIYRRSKDQKTRANAAAVLLKHAARFEHAI